MTREDTISRHAAKRIIYDEFEGWPTEEEIVQMKRLIKNLDELPPVSVAKKVEIGHWSRKTKVDAYDLYGVKTWGIKCQCDRCTFTTTVVEDFGYYKYCPNCGARMEVEQDGD